jgi:hypothetical protein
MYKWCEHVNIDLCVGMCKGVSKPRIYIYMYLSLNNINAAYPKRIGKVGLRPIYFGLVVNCSSACLICSISSSSSSSSSGRISSSSSSSRNYGYCLLRRILSIRKIRVLF